MKRIIAIILAFMMVLSLTACGIQKDAEVSDIRVYKNGKIYTANTEREYVTAFVIENGKFIYVGDDEGAASYEKGLSAKNIVDLNGASVTPGLIEGHTHFSFMAVMHSLDYEELTATTDKEENLRQIREFVDAHPDYDQYVIGNFSQVLDMDASDLDRICADKPLICIGMGLHCGYVNSKFLENGNITKDSPDAVPGQSYYVRDEEGNPTGKIVELPQTWDAFQKAVKLDEAKVREALLYMQELYHSYGFIGIADGGFLGIDDFFILDEYKSLEDAGELEMVVSTASIWYGSNISSIDEIRERALSEKEKYTSELIHPGTVKMWADGTLGALSALLREPYDVKSDKPVYGAELTTLEDLIACAQMCKDNDLNCHLHAIGDKAIENVLTSYETVGKSTGTQSLVHFEISSPDLIERASKIDGLIINMTPEWNTPLVAEEVDVVGERRNTFGLFKETMDAGITVNFGADSNGDAYFWNPKINIACAMLRDPNAEVTLLKGNSATYEECIDAYTINVAKERRIDNEYGSIEVGKNADFVIWSTDMAEMTSTADLPNICASKVFFKGEQVYACE